MTSSSMADREREALLRVGRFRFLTTEQVEHFLFGTRSDLKPNSRRVMTKQVLASLRRQGLIERTPRAIGGPEAGSTRSAYFVRPAGMRAIWSMGAGLEPKRTAPKGTFLLRHALALADAALAFDRSALANPGHAVLTWEPEWEAAQRSGRHAIVPDAYVVYLTKSEELHAFIEMDLGTAGSRFFQTKIEKYLDLYRAGTWQQRFPVWPIVLTVAPTATRATLLRTATERVLHAQFDEPALSKSTEFAFTDLPALVREGPLASIWHRTGARGPEPLLDQE